MTLYALGNPHVAFPALKAGSVCSGGSPFAASVRLGMIVSPMIAGLFDYPKV